MINVAATPFTGVLKFAGDNNSTFNYYVTVSDVVGAYWLYPDGQGQLQLPLDRGYIYLVDCILSAAGVDTKYAQIIANGKNSGESIAQAMNVATNQARQFQGSALKFKPGSVLRLTQT